LRQKEIPDCLGRLWTAIVQQRLAEQAGNRKDSSWWHRHPFGRRLYAFQGDKPHTDTVVTAAGNKEDLAAIGRAKRKATEGRPSKETAVINDNSISPDTTPTPKHDTRKAMAEAAGVSTGLVAQ